MNLILKASIVSEHFGNSQIIVLDFALLWDKEALAWTKSVESPAHGCFLLQALIAVSTIRYVTLRVLSGTNLEIKNLWHVWVLQLFIYLSLFILIIYYRGWWKSLLRWTILVDGDCRGFACWKTLLLQRRLEKVVDTGSFDKTNLGGFWKHWE